MLAHVADFERELSLDLLVGIFGKADCAGTGQGLHASRNVEPIAVDIALVDDDIADIDADAELDPAIVWNVGIAPSHGTLDFQGTAHGLDRAGKLH